MDSKKRLYLFGFALLLVLGVVGGRFLRPRKARLPRAENVPQNPASQVCLKISQPDNAYYCLAVANQEVSFCQNLDMPSEKKLCQGMAARDISYCREIQEAEPKKMCYYELSLLADEFDYCGEMEDAKQCYFAFIYRLHWKSRADEIKAEYCEKIDDGTPKGLILKNICLAFKEQDPSFCQEDRFCLSFFPQPLSFCQTPFKNPDGEFVEKDECLLHRALSEKEASLCENIENDDSRNMCYADMSTHVSPNLSFCDQITDEMVKDMCYAEYAINLQPL